MPDMTTIHKDLVERVTGLVVDEALLPVWRTAFPDRPSPRGLAGAVIGDRASVIVALEKTPQDNRLEHRRPEFAAAMGAASVELVVVPVDTLTSLIRAWLYQAAQGSGRGVHLRLESDQYGGLRVLVQAIDSSARELAFRLASDQEPALPALRALLGGINVTVLDRESADQSLRATPPQ